MVLAFALAIVSVPLVVACCLPQNFWHCFAMNCRRLDGSVSERRSDREFSAIGQFLGTMTIPAFVACTSLFVVLSLFFTFVIPVDLLSRGVEVFDFDPAVWKENLAEVRTEHTRFMKDRGASYQEIRATQELLWHGSPGIVAGFLFLCLGIVMAFAYCVRLGVRDLAKGMRQRREAYARCDVSRMRRATRAEQATPHGTSLSTY